MLDVEFLQKPHVSLRLLYVYRSGRLRLPMVHALEQMARAQGLSLIRHDTSNFVSGLSGLFKGLHLTDLGETGETDRAQVLRATLAYDGPAAVFLPAVRDRSASEIWQQAQTRAIVVEEAQPGADTVEAILGYAMAVSDLSPPPGLLSDPLARSHFLGRLAQYQDVGDFLQDFDDFVLTKYGRTTPIVSDPQVGVKEVSLVKALRSFLLTFGIAEEKKLLEQALLRGDDEKLVLGALTGATISLLSHYRRQPRHLIDEIEERCILWALALLDFHLSAGLLEGSHASSWRSRPDVRPFIISQLCRDQRRLISDPVFRGRLVSEAVKALRRLPILGGGDEKAATRLSLVIVEVIKQADMPPQWCSELHKTLEVGPKRTLPLVPQFSTRLKDIKQQAFAEHLRRRIVERAIDDPVLFHGHSVEDLEKVVSAWTTALLCIAPKDGDACGSCESCCALSSKGSASVAVALLASDAVCDDDDQREKAAERQVQEVRKLVILDGLWVGRKVIVLDGVDRVRKQALNRLLKVIEEAPTLTTFVFVAQQLRQVPVALRSRSWAVSVKGMPIRA